MIVSGVYYHGNARTDMTARELIEWLVENQINFCSTKNVITRERGGREPAIDLVFASLNASASFQHNDNSRNLVEVVASNHKLQQWNFYLKIVNLTLDLCRRLKKYNINKADWDDKVLTDHKRPKDASRKIDSTSEILGSVIIAKIKIIIPKTKTSPRSKSFWTEKPRAMKCTLNEK